jgi:exopolyphosphatase/guanosine-5'-triphosphate,3'-diphosphate pyrophosphatase
VGCHHTAGDKHLDDAEPDVRGERACIVRRAAYDIGSATTKVKVAEIDRCQGRLLAMLYTDHAPVFYRDDVNSPTPAFTPATMDKGLEVLASFAERAAAYSPAESAAVATSAFRRADNGHKMRARIERELGIPVRIISQLQEARIGFVGTVLRAGVDPRRAVVWDVGGRSMQISSLQPNGRMQIYQGALASGQMRDYLIRTVKGQPATVRTPNPLSQDQATEGRAYAESYASRKVPEGLRDKLSSKKTVVLGIGALKYYGDRPAEEKGAACTPDNLAEAIASLLDKSDEEIGGDYASTAVSDRLLLSGFMRALTIERVTLVDVELSDGLLFESEYWRSEGRRAQWIFFRERWGTRVESSPSFAFGPSRVPHMVLQR